MERIYGGCHLSRKLINMKRTVNFVFCALLISHFNYGLCASIKQTPGLTSSTQNIAIKPTDARNKSETSTFARRQLPLNLIQPSLIGSTPATFGYPLYGSPTHFLPYQFVTSATTKGVQHENTGKVESRENEFGVVLEEDKGSNKLNILKSNKTKSKSKSKRKNEDVKKIPNVKVDTSLNSTKESESHGTKRGCPACEAGDCDPMLDPHVNLSGIPIIQIIIAGLVGAFWAAIFLFILKNFVEKDKGEEEGYYDAPEHPSHYGEHSTYETPSHEYGEPSHEYASPAHYNVHRIANRYGRKSAGLTFNDITEWVLGTIDKAAEIYGKMESGKEH